MNTNKYIDQKKFQEKNIIVTILFLIVIALFTLGAYFTVTRITEQQCTERMEEAVRIVADDIGSKLSRDSTILRSMAEIIAAENHYDEESLQILISRFTPLTTARKINLLLPGDRIISQSGLTIDVNGKISFEREAPLGEHVSERMQSISDDSRFVIRHFFPIEKDGRTIALIYTTTNLKDLPDSLNIQNIYGGNAEIYLVDRKNGDMLMDTLHENLGNIWDFASYKAVRSKSVPQSHNEVMSGQTGYNVFRSEDTGDVSYCYYAPIDEVSSLLGGDVNHWSVLVEVPERIVMQHLNKVRWVFNIVGVLEIIAILIYFLWMLRNTRITMEKAILEERLVKAENAERAKTRFLSSMSHDIRTPMNAIIGFTTLASAHTDDPAKVEDYLSKILSSSNHLLSLINEILDMSRIESGKVEIIETECTLPGMVSDIENIIANQAEAKKINFITDISEVQDIWVWCDKLHLNQVLLNLLSNAVKFTPEGGTVSFTIKQGQGAPDGRARYAISVKDTGIGMSPEFVKHVFEPFERESTATVSGIQGTGLGMSIAKSIVDMMGGTIEVFSEQGKGTEYVVTLYLRLREPDEQEMNVKAREEKSAAALPVAAPDVKGKRLLLVEDNELNREIATEILSAAGLIVETACDGTEAVEIMQNAKPGYFNLILMDVQMPVMNGYDASKAIRAIEDPEIANIPIIAMTANAFEEDKQLALQNGMNDHLAKPIDINRFFEVIGRYIRK
ncbi:MAG: response regulator [Oscillospiraceae bacterium]|nr:response regulator [Oscillospiraceae bacterium]